MPVRTIESLMPENLAQATFKIRHLIDLIVNCDGVYVDELTYRDEINLLCLEFGISDAELRGMYEFAGRFDEEQLLEEVI